MLRIGSFARFSQLSIVTLRHYDDIGLLTPSYIDPETGYRYYRSKQLFQLHRILVLKDLGLSLEQIKQIVTEDLSHEQVQGMLKLKLAEEKQSLHDTQDRLKRIEVHLRQLEMETAMANYDIVIKTLPPQRVASQRLLIPSNDQVPDYLHPAFKKLSQHLEKHGVRASAPCFTLWHTPSDAETNEDVEVIFPIEKAVDESDEIKIYTLPEVQVASTVHQGDFDDFTQAHIALLAWIEENGYKVSGAFREIYFESDEGNSTTEVQFEITKR